MFSKNSFEDEVTRIADIQTALGFARLIKVLVALTMVRA